MLSRILKGAAAAALVAVVGGALLYVAGLRIVIYGDRWPRLQFVTSADRHAADLARHRQAQRAAAAADAPAAAPPSAPPSAPAPQPAAAAGDDKRAEPAADPAPAPAAGSSYWTGFRGPERNGT